MLKTTCFPPMHSDGKERKADRPNRPVLLHKHLSMSSPGAAWPGTHTLPALMYPVLDAHEEIPGIFSC